MPDDRSRPSMTARMWAVADRLLTAPVHGQDGRVRKRVFYPLYALRVLLQVVRVWVRDRCPQKAGALAFQTTLALVPLVTVALALLRAFGQFGAESALVDVIAKQVLPVSREEISAHLLEWSHHVSLETAGVVGVTTVLVLAFVTASTVERIFNDIWRAERQRRLLQRVLVFYGLATVAPALIGVSLYHAARFGLTEGVLGALGALAATWAALVMANKLLPTPPVRWKSAMIGALVSAVLFEAAKHGFRLYVANVAWSKYAGIYGALGLVPITLLWIYYTWLVVLLGAEVAYALQHLHDLELVDRRARRHEDTLDRVCGPVAARLVLACAAAERQGAPAPTRDDLVRRFELPVEAVDRMLRKLVTHKVLRRSDADEPGYQLARPAEELSLATIYAPFRGRDLLPPAVRAESRTPLDQALARVEGGADRELATVTVAELLR